MSLTQRKTLFYLLATIGIGGILFNLFQGIVIIAGSYNRNPNIESPVLQILDSVALTGLWLLVSCAILFVALSTLRPKKEI